MNLPYFDLTGKIAIVSGGATGLGLGMSEALAEAGATVVVCSRRLEVCEQSAKELTDKTGGKVVPLRCDVTDKEEVAGLVKQVKEDLGGIDILVNCAGIGGAEKPILEMSDEDWDGIIAINLKGAYTFSQAVVPVMIEQGRGGRIINVSSIAGLRGMRYMSGYCTSKAALTHLTKVMALEWVKHNILVNALLPGYFETPLNTHFFASKAGQRVIGGLPMKRLAQLPEIKGITVLLASEASSFITGADIVIDGGHTA